MRKDVENYVVEAMAKEMCQRMREGIRGSDKTMDVGWNEGR